MNLSLSEIRERRGILLERARSERFAIGQLVNDQRELLGLVDTGAAIARFLAKNKHLLAVAAVSFALVQPRRALRWGLRMWQVFRIARRMRRTLLK